MAGRAELKAPMMEKKLKLAPMFSERMVLQRGKRIPVWGEGETGRIVSVTLNGQEKTAEIMDGTWKLLLEPEEACSDTFMEVRCGEEAIRISHAAIGEVWLAGGQSNMEFFLRYDKDHDEALENGENANVFFFDYPEVCYEGQLEENDYSRFGFWRPCTRENMDYYSAVGYYFADKLQKELKVPVGIIGCNWGGTSASCWMPAECLKGTPGEIWLEEYQKEAAKHTPKEYEELASKSIIGPNCDPFGDPEGEKMMYGISKEELLDLIPVIKDMLAPVIGPKSPWRPGGCYEYMLKKIAPYSIRGVIWYQGEADDIHADIYDVVFSNMIRCWRMLWDEELPFLLVQIAPLEYWFSGEVKNYPIIREQQEKATALDDRVWMTTTGDVGMAYDVHPKEKKAVGERLALLAEGHVYQMEVLCDPPTVDRWRMEKGKLTLHFEHAEGGLAVKGNQVKEMKCRVDGEEVIPVSCKVSGEEVVLVSPAFDGKADITVFHAKTPYHEVNLYNQSQIPARPFEVRIPKTE